MIESNIDDSRLTAKFEQLIKGAQNTSPLMAQISGIMMDEVEQNFRDQGRPAWLGFKYEPSDRRGGASAKLLQDSGQLAASIQESNTSNTASVGTNKKYAAIHQFGGKTAAHVIKPRNKKALAFGGRVFKSVNHPGSDIPARPFLMITDSGQNKILDKTSAYLRNLID